MKKYSFIAVAAILISVFALYTSYSANPSHQNGQATLADKVTETGTLRVGYIVYPPSLNKDPNTGELSGISYDLVNSAAKRLGLKAEWVEEVGWDSAIEGLHAGRYDIVGTMMWANSARGKVAGLSNPVAYSTVDVYVRTGDNRFSSDLSLLNSPDYTIATVDGEMTSFIHDADFPNSQTYSLTQNSSLSEALLGVTSLKADATFVAPDIAKDFEANNPGQIQKVGTAPIRTFANVFVVDRGEAEFLSMWNTALSEMSAEGEISRTLDTYEAKDSYLPPTSTYGTSW